MVLWLALLTRIQGDVGSIRVRGIFTNFSDKFLSLTYIDTCLYNKSFSQSTPSPEDLQVALETSRSFQRQLGKYFVLK